MSADPTKILVVDDSALYRQSIQNVLRDVSDVTIVGSAKNGIDALAKIEELDPDLLTLDVQMPDMDGIEVLSEIKRRRWRPKAIMVSSLTAEGAKVTTDALLMGAFDFILKPSSNDPAANRQQLRDALIEKVLAYRGASVIRRGLARRSAPTQPSERVAQAAPVVGSACQAVILGTSTGGPEALKTVLPRIPADLPVPVLIVQHMPPQYTTSLAARLDNLCPLNVSEAKDRTAAVAGSAIIAPGGQQMKLVRAGANLLLRVNDAPPENGVRPAVDYLLRSAAEALSGHALAVIMTGMGRDGLAGCQAVKQAGGYVFAQDQQDCVVYGMSKAVIEAKMADRVLPLGKIAPAIVRHLKRSRRSSSEGSSS